MNDRIRMDHLVPGAAAPAAGESIADAEQKVLAGVPGKEIPIITGGEAVGAVRGFGPPVLVEIIDVLDPRGSGVFPIAISSRSGEFARKLPLNTPTLVPEGVVRHLESNSMVETNVRRIDENSALFGRKDLAEAQNPGMRFYANENGCFLVRKFRRYIVRRVRPEDMTQD